MLSNFVWGLCRPVRGCSATLRVLGRVCGRVLGSSVGSVIGLALVAMCLMGPGPAHAAVGPTVKEVIEFTRIIQPLGHDNDALQSQISPDGRQAFIVIRQAELASDKNHFRLLLLDTDPSRLASGQAREPVVLWSVDAQRDRDEIDPALREARWVGDRTIVFRARVQDRPFQVYRLDLPTRRLTQLSFEPRGVVHFEISDNLRRLVYVVPVPNPAMPAGERSVVVGTHSFWSVHFGQDDLRTQQRRYRFMTARAGVQGAQALGESFAESSGGFPRASLSPDGRWALLPRYEPSRQIAWGEQYPLVADATRRYGPSLSLDPLGYYSRPFSYIARRLVAYRLADGRMQGVVDAPDDSLQSNQLRSDRLWQRGGKSVVVAGTFLPQGVEDAGARSASHIIEYWPDLGQWKPIATLAQRLKAAHAVPGKRDGFIAIDGDTRRRFERGDDGTWREVDAAQPADGRGAWTLRVDEALNRPPDIVATGPGGTTRRLTQLNPQYDAVRWGVMREYGWKDGQGRVWNGGLMVPADFDPKARHALVIQTYGFSPSRFYRDGSNVYDGFTSGFPGRAFLREGILVLALPWRPSTGNPQDEHDQIHAFADGVAGAIEALVAEGWVDRRRIGIMGWSASGERVLNLLTFSDTPIRAASLLDGDANTLFSMTITYSVQDGIQARKERANLGGPYGQSLARWVRNDPSLHTDCVRAALRIETYGAEVHNNWDIYALLRRQYRPVEMIVFPLGSHALSRPSERWISIQGNVDWYRFWLQGRLRSEPMLPGENAEKLAQQHARWRQMAELKEAVDMKPGCARWTGE